MGLNIRLFIHFLLHPPRRISMAEHDLRYLIWKDEARFESNV